MGEFLQEAEVVYCDFCVESIVNVARGFVGFFENALLFLGFEEKAGSYRDFGRKGRGLRTGACRSSFFGIDRRNWFGLVRLGCQLLL